MNHLFPDWPFGVEVTAIRSGSPRIIWCREVLGTDAWFIDPGKAHEKTVTFRFKDENDAILFALKWS